MEWWFQIAPEMTLPQLFEKQAHINPNSIAVVFEDKKLTYEELNRKANKIARFLIAKGIGPDQLVALAMPRSLNMVVSLLAVLKAGAGYLPLDPDYPADRISFMLHDAKPSCVLTNSEVEIECNEALKVLVDDVKVIAEVEKYSEDNIDEVERIKPLSPSHIAYVIYTSGSRADRKAL